jgi:hypothetical protein
MLSNRNANRDTGVKKQRTAKAQQGRRRGETAVMYGAADEWLEEQPLRDRRVKAASK